jgi:hypothetical protein
MLLTPKTKIGYVLFLLRLTTILAIQCKEYLTIKHINTTKKISIELDKNKLFSNT